LERLGGRRVIRLKRRADVTPTKVISAALLAAAAALILSLLLLEATGVSAFAFVGLALSGPLTSWTGFSDTITLAGVLMLTGLATMLALRVGIMNLGAEGQVIAAALAALAITTGVLPIPRGALIPVAVLAGIATGALTSTVVTVFKLRLRLDESLITVMMNVILVFALQLTTGSALSSFPPIGSIQALPLASVRLPGWGHALYADVIPLIAVLACLTTSALVRYTVWGLDMKATGGNPVAARFAGIQVRLVRLNVALVSGALIGLAGAGPVIGGEPGLTLGLGYGGIAVAFLAALQPLGIIPAALFVAVLLEAVSAAGHDLGLQAAFGSVIVAVLLLTALVAQACARFQLQRRETA
jgi:general nucleoside transport system permease protein